MRVPLPGSILRAVARTAVARSPGFYGKADRGGPKNVPVAPPIKVKVVRGEMPEGGSARALVATAAALTRT